MEDMVDEQEPNLGIRLKQLRLDKGWILSQLASATGLSEAYLSRIETGARTPSVGTIFSVARALDIPVAQVFDEPEAHPTYAVHRSTDHAGAVVGGQAIGVSSSAPWASMEALRLTLAGGHPGAASRHRGEEFVLVRSGRVLAEIGTDTVTLETGDTIHFDASIEHTLSAMDDVSAEVLLIAADNRSAAAQSQHLHSY